MSEKRARVSPAFVSPPPEQQVPVDRDSGASSRATSEVFTIKPSSARNNRPYPELLRSTPVKQQGFLRTILRGIRALWATRQTEKDLRKNKDLYVKTTLRELIIYLVFITVLCIITFGMTSTKTYYFTSVLRTIFTERIVYGAGDKPHFNDINDFEDFWEVLEGPVLDALSHQQWYNGEPLKADQRGYILFENKILGKARLRQLRVGNQSCTVHKKFQAIIPECYGSYKSSRESRIPFEPENDTLGLTAWTYQTASKLKGSSSSGMVSRYGGGGYVQVLDAEYKIAEEQLKILKQNLWLDRGTRVVFLDLTVYNGNINLFCQIKLTVEFPASGGTVASKSFSTVKLIRYVSSMDYFVLACEIIFIIFTVYYTVEETIEIKRFKFHYFKNLWNTLDVVILLISYVCIAFNIYRQAKVAEILDALLKARETFSDFEFLTYWQTQFNNVIAFTVFLAWIKIFKYVSFNKTMTQLSATLVRCAKDVLGFSVMFMIVFLAYAQLGYLLFGSQVTDYRTFGVSVFTLFRIVLGDFDFQAILTAHRILGPIFFLTYVFFVFFVLLNMFLAIINDTYSAVKSDMTTQKSEFELTAYFKKSYDKMLDRLNVRRHRIIDIRNALKNADINQDGAIQFSEWRRDLKARGYTDVEIENLFSRYDANGDRTLHDAEMNRIRTDLIAEENTLDNDLKDLKEGHSNKQPSPQTMMSDIREDAIASNNQSLPLLERRIDRMEYSVGNAISRIDVVLGKLQSVEKVKNRRLETLQKTMNLIRDDEQISEQVKQQRLEKLLRDEIDEIDADPLGLGLRGNTLATPDQYQSNISLQEVQEIPNQSKP